jgi:hypothetical protein
MKRKNYEIFYRNMWNSHSRDYEDYCLGKWCRVCHDAGIYLPSHTRVHVPPNSNLLLFAVQFLLHWVTSYLSGSISITPTLKIWASHCLQRCDAPYCTDASQQYAAVLCRVRWMQRNVFYWALIAQSKNCTYAPLGINKRQTSMGCIT